MLDGRQIGFAPGVPHLANFPFAALQRTGFAAAFGGHLVNLPLASLQGAARTGVDNSASVAAAAKNMRMVSLPRLNRARERRHAVFSASALTLSECRG
jgi:hypothetical protein